MRPSTRKYLFLLLAALLMTGAASGVRPLNEMRERYGLSAAPIPETAQPSMMLRPILAIGRAPLVDYLWLRATKLKDSGRYFDALQLSELICKLQPRFASVWSFQAWNMAYNISVTLKTPEERWRWVRNGYELLRDQAIPINPRSTELYRQLAWILFHKVGDTMDEMHYYYKLQFAMMVEDVLGQPDPSFIQPGRVHGDFYRDYDFRRLADTPDRYEELAEDKAVSELADALKRFKFDVSQPGVYVGLLDALRRGDIRIEGAEANVEEDLKHDLKVLMADPARADARSKLDAFWRAQMLHSRFKLDPERILDLHKAIGVPLDWRLPWAHALYWSNMGVERGSDRLEAIDIHKLNTNRIEFFCLNKMFDYGRMAMRSSPELGEPPYYGPDLRFGEVVWDIYLNDSGIREHGAAKADSEGTSIFSGFVGFARRLVLRYAEAGDNEKAKEKFDFLRANFPDPLYDRGFDIFVMQQYRFDRENLDLDTTVATLRGLISRAVNQFAADEDEMARRSVKRANEIYKLYNASVASPRLRIRSPFDEIVSEVVHGIGGRMYRSSYEKVCRKFGLKPMAPATETQPAESP